MSEDQDTIDRAASAWLVRTEEGALNPEEDRAFAAWQAADPRHAEALSVMRRAWDRIGEMDHLVSLAPSLQPVPSFAPVRPPAYRRRGMIAVGMAVAASVAAVVLWPLAAPVSGPHYETRVAELRRVSLPDGSTVTLGPRSTIRVRYSDRERRIELAQGEAFFDVVHGPRPFVVDAGTSIVRDLGTRFDVNRANGSVRVSVLEGAVEVARIDADRSPVPRVLRAGQRTEVMAMPTTAVAATATAPAALTLPVLETQAAGAWRDGGLVYDRVRLADVAADLNRYYAPGVQLASPEIGNLRVTAAFRTSEIPAFLGVLDDTLPVRASRSPDGGFTLSPAPRCAGRGGM